MSVPLSQQSVTSKNSLVCLSSRKLEEIVDSKSFHLKNKSGISGIVRSKSGSAAINSNGRHQSEVAVQVPDEKKVCLGFAGNNSE